MDGVAVAAWGEQRMTSVQWMRSQIDGRSNSDRGDRRMLCRFVCGELGGGKLPMEGPQLMDDDLLLLLAKWRNEQCPFPSDSNIPLTR